MNSGCNEFGTISLYTLPPLINSETSRKWLTVAIFRKWQDTSVALWIEIAVILIWRLRLEIWYGFVWFCCLLVVWYGGGVSQMHG